MSDLNLFLSEEDRRAIPLSLKDATVVYYPNFISSKYASEVFQKLFKESPWREDIIKIFGKVYKQPRLTALYGEEGKSYSYSGITMSPSAFTPLLHELKTLIEKEMNIKFNTVLLNLYRDGNDSNGWHSDDEKELGNNPVIASMSLGAKRNFHLKHKKDKKLKFKLFISPKKS